MLSPVAYLHGGCGEDLARFPRRTASPRRALLAMGLVCVVFATGCSVEVPGGSSINGSTKPITRQELLVAFGDLATALERSGSGLAGRQAALNACIEFPRLLDRELNNPKGVLLRSDDVPFLQLAKDKCPEAPPTAAYLIREVLYDTRPRDGVEEPKCAAGEVGVRFGRSGVDSSGVVYLRIELVSRTSRLCVVDGSVVTRVLTADGQSLHADPVGNEYRYRTLPGRGMVQWLRLSYKATQALCTGRLVPVKELRVELPTGDGPRSISVSALPAVARNYCPDAPPDVVETPEASLTGP